jgi:hypothetical protein
MHARVSSPRRAHCRAVLFELVGCLAETPILEDELARLMLQGRLEEALDVFEDELVAMLFVDLTRS